VGEADDVLEPEPARDERLALTNVKARPRDHRLPVARADLAAVEERSGVLHVLLVQLDHLQLGQQQLGERDRGVVYAPGLHHLAFAVETRADVNAAHATARRARLDAARSDLRSWNGRSTIWA